MLNRQHLKRCVSDKFGPEKDLHPPASAAIDVRIAAARHEETSAPNNVGCGVEDRGIAQVVALVRSNRVGHHSLPRYSNVLYLQARGTKNFGSFKITGWENELMNIDQIAPASSASQPAAA